MSAVKEPIPNPDITIKFPRGRANFIPMTCKGEEWLIAAVGQDRPYKSISPSDFVGRRSFVVAASNVDSLEAKAKTAGLVVYRLKDGMGQ